MVTALLEKPPEPGFGSCLLWMSLAGKLRFALLLEAGVTAMFEQSSTWLLVDEVQN